MTKGQVVSAEDRFRDALKLFADVDCQEEPSDHGIWCVGCVATNILAGSTIYRETENMGGAKHWPEKVAEKQAEIESLRKLCREAAAHLRANEWTMPAIGTIRALAKRLEEASK